VGLPKSLPSATLGKSKCIFHAYNNLKLSNGFGNLPNFNINQSMLPIAYKKVLKPNSNLIITLAPNLIYPSPRYYSSSKKLRFVSVVRDKLFETFSIFYLDLNIWYHDILTNLVIFGLCFNFLEFKNHSTTRSWSCFPNNIFEISFHFLDKASNTTQ